MADSPDGERTATVAPRAALSSTPAPVLARGDRVGRYEILDAIGEGGMGKVYAANDPQLSRKVALKLLHMPKGSGGPDSEGSSRLLREAQALAQLAHPNIVAIFDVGTHGGNVFLTMELVEGTNLTAWLKQQPRGWREVLEVFRAAGEGLAAAHAKGLIHRDFKPDNVLLGTDGRVRVVDFGLARALHSGDPLRKADVSHAEALNTPLTAEGSFSGTVGYIAPEQLAEHPQVDERSDQFAFGVSLYAGLFGQKPFEGRTFLDYHQAVQRGPPPTAPQGRDVPPWLFRAVSRAIAKDPAARFESMRALLDTLAKDPSVARRRALLGSMAAALVVTLGVFTVRGLTAPQVHPSCSASEPLAQDWSEARRTVLNAAFLGSGHPDAQATAQKVSAQLDSYAQQWRAARDTACAQSQGPKADRALLELSCLGQLREQLGALVAELEHADAMVAGHAVGAVQSLSRPDRCGDPRVLLGNMVTPVDPKVRLATQALRSRFAVAHALSDAGKYLDAIEKLKALAADAHAVPSKLVEADALILLGRLQSRLALPDEAAATLTDAMTISQQEGFDLQAFQASARLAFSDSNSSRPKTAELAYKIALASYARLPKDEYLEAELAEAAASLFGSQGKYDEAEVQRNRVYTLRLKLLGADHVETLAALNNVAKGYIEMGKAVEAEQAYVRAAGACEQVLGPSHPGTAITLTNHGEALTVLGRYAEAQKVIAHGLELAERFLGADSPNTGWALLNMCNAIARGGDPNSAMPFCDRAVKIEENGDPPDQALALGYRGQALRQLGRLADAKADCVRGADLSRGAGDLPEGVEARICVVELKLQAKQTDDLMPELEKLIAMKGKAFGPERGRIRFLMAQTKWLDAASRPVALDEAKLARDAYDGVPGREPEKAAIEKWLAERQR